MSEAFRTQNEQLAFALATAGCRWDEEDGGPMMNIYSLDFLRQRKIGIGKSIDEAVQEAVDKQIPGKVIYFFVRDELFNRCIHAWDTTADELSKSDNERRDPVFEKLVGEENIMQILCVHSANRRNLRKKVWDRAAFIAAVNSKTREVPIKGRPAPRQVTEGVGKVWQLGASKAVRDKLKI